MNIKKDMYIMLNSIKESLGKEVVKSGYVSYDNIGFSEEYGGMIMKILVDEEFIKDFVEIEFNGAEFPHFRKKILQLH